MMKIAICEDELTDKILIDQKLRSVLKEKGVTYDISYFKNGEELLLHLRDGEKYQLILLDIMLGGVQWRGMCL